MSIVELETWLQTLLVAHSVVLTVVLAAFTFTGAWNADHTETYMIRVALLHMLIAAAFKVLRRVRFAETPGVMCFQANLAVLLLAPLVCAHHAVHALFVATQCLDMAFYELTHCESAAMERRLHNTVGHLHVNGVAISLLSAAASWLVHLMPADSRALLARGEDAASAVGASGQRRQQRVHVGGARWFHSTRGASMEEEYERRGQKKYASLVENATIDYMLNQHSIELSAERLECLTEAQRVEEYERIGRLIDVYYSPTVVDILSDRIERRMQSLAERASAQAACPDVAHVPAHAETLRQGLN
ncbi:hypothetical protein HDU67_000865 [Dinochytrium kinnereticum]|nr:hypothetical protein HDU67_000865 [Dinochytrium kinnereticum]